MVVEDSTFLLFWCVSSALAFPPSIGKLSLIDLIFLYLSAMEMFESVPKLPNIFGCIRLHDSISMDGVVFPLPDVFDSVFIFLVVDLDIGEFTGI